MVLHFDKPSVVGVGLGRTFGIQIAEAAPNVTVGLISCAAGGSPIASWEPGGFHRQTNSHPYDDTVRRTKPALEDGTLKGILWHQVESDCKPETSAVYQQKLPALIRRLRNEFDAPDVPWLIGQLGQFPERPWNEDKERVDRAHRELAEQVPHCAFISSDDLTHRGDKTHFDAASYREFGKRYAGAFLKMSKEASGKQ